MLAGKICWYAVIYGSRGTRAELHYFTIEIIFLPKLENTHATKCEKINLNKEFKGLTLRRLLISGWVFTIRAFLVAF